jgi:lipopolysaccharide/colanic/teichoic acid biosynthesis glycosyltransferase
VLKRSVDIVLAGLLLAAALPLIVIAAIIVKLDSDGPVFFLQARMGRGFRRFELLKLRTMRLSREGSIYTLGADPRITRSGQWLRWLKFDELPQLWNVLRGDMSMVGPRPVVPELAMEFRREYQRLLEVRPGLTDPGTMKYCRETEILAQVPEPLRYFKTVIIPEKLRLSKEYLDRASVWTDFSVMIGTALALVPDNWRVWQRWADFFGPLGNISSTLPEYERMRYVHPVMEDALIEVPIELLASVEENNGSVGQMSANQLA